MPNKREISSFLYFDDETHLSWHNVTGFNSVFYLTMLFAMAKRVDQKKSPCSLEEPSPLASTTVTVNLPTLISKK